MISLDPHMSYIQAHYKTLLGPVNGKCKNNIQMELFIGALFCTISTLSQPAEFFKPEISPPGKALSIELGS